MTSESHAATAVSRMQNRIPASLYEVAWQYSLFGWYSAVDSDVIDWDLDPKHLTYLTPRAKSELFGEEDSLIVAYVDLSDPENPSLRAEEDGGPVEITTYTADNRFRIGYSRPIDKTNQTAHSITTHQDTEAYRIAGLEDAWYGRGNLQDRFNRWIDSEYAETVREETTPENRRILEALSELGDNEEEMDRLADRFLQLAGGEDAEYDALLTVAIRTPGRSEYRLPGVIEVLNEVMYEKKLNRLDSISVEDASGDGTGYVTGDANEVTGGSPGLLGMNGKKQREHFADLDTTGGNAWNARPLEFDTAAAIASAGSLFNDFYRGLRYNRRIYILPYIAARRVEISPETFEWFYQRIYARLQAAEHGADGTFDDVLEELFIEASQARSEANDSADESATGLLEATPGVSWDDVRFAVVHQVTGNPERVYFDTLDGMAPATELEDAHNQATGSPLFENGGIFHNNPTPDSSPLLGVGLKLARYILYGGYFRRTTEPTRSSREANEPPGAGSLDDSQMRPVRNLLTGTQIDASSLLEEYIHQLVQDQRDQFGDDSGFMPFPKRSVVEQYVQLRALNDIGALDTTNTLEFTTTQMTTEYEDRSARLTDFIENHDALDGMTEEAVFVLGGLVGRISAYQDYKNVSSTLIRRYPVDYLTKQTVKEVTKEVLQMNNSYAEADEKRSYRTNGRYTERLTDTMLAADPTTWELNESELQWLYSLGIAYGLSDSSLESEESDDDQTTESDT
jgi:hypothetical protein